MRRILCIALLALASLAGTAFATVHEVPLMKAAGGFQQGFVRVATFDVGGEVRIEAWDDAGHFAETTLTVSRNSVQGFNSEDLQSGDADKGMPEGIGSPTVGDWRLKLSAGFDFDVNAYVRTGDGFVTSVDSLHRVPRNAGSTEIDFFNPGSNYNQVSGLRIINEDEEESAEVTIRGTEDRPSEKDRKLPLFSARPAFMVSVPPLSAVSVTASELEKKFRRPVDTDEEWRRKGKWRLKVTSKIPVTLLNLLETPTGHVTNFGRDSGSSECSGGGGRLNANVPQGVYMGGKDYGAINRADDDLNRTTWRFGDLQRANFRGADLYDARFWYANLRFANFSGSNLSRTSFNRADLAGADFGQANLSDTNFYSANLAGSDFSGVIRGRYRSHFGSAALCDSDLMGADLNGSNFNYAILKSVRAYRVVLDGASLIGADVSSSYLREASLEGADLREADLTDTDLTDSDLERAYLGSALLVEVRLDDSNLEGADLSAANLTGASVRNADLQSAKLNGALLYRANFRTANLSKSNLSWAVMVEGDFRDADFREANVYGANLTRADLRGADVRGIDFCNSWWRTGIQINKDTRTEDTQCLLE